jgi:hypothetical protein
VEPFAFRVRAIGLPDGAAPALDMGMGRACGRHGALRVDDDRQGSAGLRGHLRGDADGRPEWRPSIRPTSIVMSAWRSPRPRKPARTNYSVASVRTSH